MRSLHFFLFFVSAFASSEMFSAHSRFKSLTVFGDSLSDMGQACPEEGEQSSDLCFLYPNGRFTNGRVWAEYLARYLELPLQTSRKGGKNFAHGGSLSDEGTLEVPGLLKQVDQYLERVSFKAESRGIYSIWTGANDFHDKFIHLNLLPLEYEDLLVETVINNISMAVADLSCNGAKYFLIPNMPPLLKAPLVQDLVSLAVSSFSGLAFMQNNIQDKKLSPIDSAVKKFNLRLKQKVDELEKLFAIRIISPDIFQFLTDMADNPELYGLRDAGEMFYLDSFHPSAEVHKEIALKFYESLRDLL